MLQRCPSARVERGLRIDPLPERHLPLGLAQLQLPLVGPLALQASLQLPLLLSGEILVLGLVVLL